MWDRQVTVNDLFNVCESRITFEAEYGLIFRTNFFQSILNSNRDDDKRQLQKFPSTYSEQNDVRTFTKSEDILRDE